MSYVITMMIGCLFGILIMSLLTINKFSSAARSRQGEELEGNHRPWTGSAAQPGQPATDEDI